MLDPGALGITRQTFNIGQKIGEFDQLLAAMGSYPGWLVEVHPEVSFCVLCEESLEPKRSKGGESRRFELLKQVFREIEAPVRLLTDIAVDDQLDAWVALWSALRTRNRDPESVVLGGSAEDEKGTPMRIVA